MIRVAALLLAASILSAQSAADWAAGLVDRFQRYTNRVVSAHSLAGLADAVCFTNKVAGAQIYRVAIARIAQVEVHDFDDIKSPVLPVASFTRPPKLTPSNAIPFWPALTMSARSRRRFWKSALTSVCVRTELWRR